MRKFYSDKTLKEICSSNGHTYISRVEDQTESIVRLSCGHVQMVKENGIVANSHECLICRENRIIDRIMLTDLIFLSVCQEKSTYSYYKYQCGHVGRLRNDAAFKSTKHQCKECRVPKEVYHANYREKNKDKIALLNKEWNTLNKDYVKNRKAKHYIENRDSFREKGKVRYQMNKALYLHYSKLRKLAQKQRTPTWLNKEQKKQILWFYKESKRLKDETDIVYHVDHIIPLCGKTVCGLHVPWNLQVLEGKENLEKSNKLLDKYLEVNERG